MGALRPSVRRLVSVWAVLLLLLGLAACGGGDAGPETGGDGAAGEDADGGGSRGPGAGDDSDGGDDRQVITTASLVVAVADALAAADEATQIVEAVGGRVDSRSERPGLDREQASADLTLRVPANRVADVLDDLEALGEPLDLTLDRQDVTLTVRDLDARIRALEVSVARLEDLMAGATSTADLLEAETALTERQADLDSLRSQRTYLGEQVALATIALALRPRDTAPTPEPGGFWGGVVTGWTALVNTLNRAVEVAGTLVPWALFAALVVGVVLLVRRLRPRRPLPGPPPPPAR